MLKNQSIRWLSSHPWLWQKTDASVNASRIKMKSMECQCFFVESIVKRYLYWFWLLECGAKQVENKFQPKMSGRSYRNRQFFQRFRAGISRESCSELWFIWEVGTLWDPPQQFEGICLHFKLYPWQEQADLCARGDLKSTTFLGSLLERMNIFYKVSRGIEFVLQKTKCQSKHQNIA